MANGRGSYERVCFTADEVSHGYPMREKLVFGFATGYMVRVVVRQGSCIARIGGLMFPRLFRNGLTVSPT